MEQGLDAKATKMTSMLAADSFRTTVRALQALHAGIIECNREGSSLFKSHAAAKAEQHTMYEVGKLIGSTSLSSMVNVGQIRDFFKAVQQNREIVTVQLPSIQSPDDAKRIMEESNDLVTKVDQYFSTSKLKALAASSA
eukprot:158632-Amphidinium_carterae.1